MTKRPVKPISGKIMLLEGARFVAAFSVMGLHLSRLFSPSSLPFAHYIFFGASPVTFFFVLSGFVMYNAYHQEFGRIGRMPRYILSRLTRIFPLYWLSLLLRQIVCDIGEQQWALIPPPYLQTILLYPTVWYLKTVEINPAAWTLRYELAYYICFMAVFIPRVGPGLLAIWFGALIWYDFPSLAYSKWLSHVTGSDPQNWPAAVSSHALVFLAFLFFAGLAGGFVYNHCRPGPKLALVLFALACAALGWEFRQEDWGQSFPPAAYTLPAGLLYAFWIAAAAMAERAGAVPRWRGFRALGVLSYPLYLLHGVVWLGFSFLAADESAFVHRLPEAVWFVMLVVASFLVSALAAWGIDRPVQRLVRRVVK